MADARTQSSREHLTALELSAPAPTEVLAGADVRLQVKASCSAGCELAGAPVKVTAPDGTAVTSKLQAREAGPSETGEIVLRAPPTIGQHVFSVVLPAHESAGVRHEEAALAITITTSPHGTSLAAWDIPSPVVLGTRFTIKVGAKSVS